MCSSRIPSSSPNYTSIKSCSGRLISHSLSTPLSAGAHQPHQHLSHPRWHPGHVQDGRPQHAGRLHPLPGLWPLQHQVSVRSCDSDYVAGADRDADSCAPPREELGLMSCDDISRYSVSSQSGSKGSEAVSYYLDQDSGQFFSLLEGDGPPGPDYDRGRNTGVRRRDKTPTHGKRESGAGRCEWGSVCVVVQHGVTCLSSSSSHTSSSCVHHWLHGSASVSLPHVPKIKH